MALTRRNLFAMIRRRHWATWVAVALTTITMVLISIPSYPSDTTNRVGAQGNPANGWERVCQRVYDATSRDIEDDRLRAEQVDPSEAPWAAYEDLPGFQVPALQQHGWPLPSVVRSTRVSAFAMISSVKMPPVLTIGHAFTTCNGVPMHYVRWSNYHTWPLTGDRWGVHPGNLLVDLVTFALVVGGVGAVVEWWLRSRGGLFRFRLIDVLAAFTICAVALAWHHQHAELRDQEARLEADLNQGAALNRFSVYRTYTGPEWLQRLAGHPDYVPLLNHVTTAVLSSSEDWQGELNRLAELPYIEELRLASPLPKAAVAQLSRFGRLKTLNYRMYSPPGDALQQWLDAAADPDLIGPTDLAALAPLPLEELSISGHAIVMEDLERALAAIPSLKRLVIVEASITRGEYEQLCQRFPAVEIREHTLRGSHETDAERNQRVGDFKAERQEALKR
ncbi:hypothetical protein Pla123a_02490 [Posidoniimonas polymericola]|uniref:Uncharacterized protein n=1 Tax=Posidoniimonas polymericola TaxID=2528002 RepID=A0A5C5ZDN5_9BACT|nr:hypothetical protein [Posidoniimonas polymericola]TWT85442.1 hypothetical protein Pla123a_02490 [Posidoniimonas polymericola]